MVALKLSGSGWLFAPLYLKISLRDTVCQPWLAGGSVELLQLLT